MVQMKKIVIPLLILLKIILPIKPYIELNHINIIHKIKITCNDKYNIEYTEIIPKKEENRIQYDYKKYKVTSNNLLDGIKKIEKNKNVYKKHAKIIIKNCKLKKEIQSKIKRG